LTFGKKEILFVYFERDILSPRWRVQEVLVEGAVEKARQAVV